MYILNLNAEEAADLNIPDSLYNVYVELVENLNESKWKASILVPEATYKASVTQGKFEGRSIERERTYYGEGLLFGSDCIY